MYRIGRVLKSGSRNIPKHSIQTIRLYDKSKKQATNIDKQEKYISNPIRNDIDNINNNIRENNNKELIDQNEKIEKIQENQENQQEELSLFNNQQFKFKSKSLKLEPFTILSYKNEIIEPKVYIDPNKVVRRDFKPEEIVNIDVDYYPMEKMPFNQNNKEQADYIQNLIYKKGIQKAIVEFHNSLFQGDADVNFFSFSFLLSSIALENGIDKSVEYFKYYVNEHYKPFLNSYRFLYYLRLIYKYNPNSVETIYEFLLNSNLIDIKMTFYFCTFYLEVNLEDKAINLINNNFKKISNNNSSGSGSGSGSNGSNTFKFLEDIWNFNYKDQLYYLDKPVMKFNKMSEEYFKLVGDFNKLFSVSSGNLRFYQLISQLFLPDGKITSKQLLPSLIKFSHLCLHFNHLELLNQVYKPYKENSGVGCLTSSQLIGMIYFYTQNRNLIDLKKYIYNNFLTNINNNNNHHGGTITTSWSFKETLLNTWIQCNLEINDYGEALRSLDIKNHILYNLPTNYDSTMERIDYFTALYDPFIGFHNYLSEIIVSSGSNNMIKDNHCKARDFWKSKQNQIIKIKPNNNNSINLNYFNSSSSSTTSSNNSKTNNSYLQSLIPPSRYPRYRPYEAPELIKQSDQLLSIKKIEGFLLRFPRRNQTKQYQVELSNILSKLKEINIIQNEDGSGNERIEKIQLNFINEIKEFYSKLNENEFSVMVNEIKNNCEKQELKKKLINHFYFKTPLSLLFIVSIQHFRLLSLGNGNISKLEEYLKFVSTSITCKPFQDLLTTKNDWFLYLFANPNLHGLKIMSESLSPSIYKSPDFYNFWLHKISEFKKQNYLPLVWKLIRFMVNNSIPIYRKSLLMFSDFIIKSDHPIINDNNSNSIIIDDQDTEENDEDDSNSEDNSISIIKDQSIESLLLSTNKNIEDDDSSGIKLFAKIENNNPWIERDILNVLKWKLRIFPSNEYSGDNIISLDRKQLEKVYRETQQAKVVTPALVELQVQLVSRIYPIPPITNFQYWLDIGKLLHDDCKITFIRSVCQSLIRLKQFNQLDSFLASNINMIGSLSIGVIQEIFKHLPPLKQAQYIQNHVKEFTFYKLNFIQYIQDLKSQLISNNHDPSQFPKLDLIISKPHKLNLDNLNLQNQEFTNLFSKLYF